MDFATVLPKIIAGLATPLGLIVVAGVLGVMLVILAIIIIANRRPDPLEKLRESARKGPSASEPQARLRTRNNAAEKLERYATFLEPQDADEMSSARLKMMQAGYRSKTAVRTFHAIQFALGMGLLLVGVLISVVNSATGQEVSASKMILTVLVPALLGYYGPKYWLERRRQARQEEITSGFPDALDMMLVCVEAGQSLDQSILRVAQETRAGYPALAEEFEIVGQEVKAGKDRVTVLKDMAERAGVADVASFVTVLVQSATFGTSIADALRVYAAEMRDKRVMRAEEKANVLPTKLTLGTMLLTVPPLMIILIGPSVYGIYQTLNGSF
jgi:tight adherence protein C